MDDDLLSDLNEAQRRAVTHGEGPLLIVAGPGSGKTRVVSRRVAWLLRRGAAAHQVMAVTFTNKAAAELRARVEALVPAGGLWVSTFHAACARILRENHEAAGYPASFTIYDEEDRRRHAGRVLREKGLAEGIRPQDLVQRIARWKGEGIGPEAVAKDAWNGGGREYALAYARYEELLAAAGAMDFDDLLLRTHRLLDQRPEVLARYRDRLRYVLVDEYQDTNRLQFLIARALASGTGNLCATGDPDQSIYRWRGADIRNILDFEEHYPAATVVRLEENYRSTRNILDAAGRLISHNRDRREKDLRCGAAAGREVRVEIFDGPDEEGEAAGEAIREALAEGIPANGVAVLYRVNARSRAVEKALLRRGIPYQIVRGVEFYQRAEVKDLVAWLRLIANPRDAEAFARVLDAPRRGAGDSARARVLEEADRRGIPVRDALSLGAGALGVRGKPGRALEAAASVLAEAAALPADRVAPLLDRVVALSGYREWLERRWPEDHQERWENVEELIAAARARDGSEEGRGLAGFLEEASLVQDQDRFDPEAPRVALMSLHACKGLEFPCVFLLGVEEGVLPHSRSLRAPDGGEGEDAAAVEEERRLLFVGMTRARRRLWLSAAFRAQGWTGGRSGPSRFLDEIRGTGVRRTSRVTRREAEWEEGGPARRPRWGSRGPGERPGPDRDFVFEADAAPPEAVARAAGLPFRPGQRVRHAKFGTGMVRRMEAHGSSMRAIVEFRTGVKTLDLDYVRLETMGDGA